MAGKKFRFPLEPVLTLRRHEAERAELTLAKALQTRREREAHLDAAEHALRTLAADAPAPSTPADLRRFAASQHEALHARRQAAHALLVARQRERDAHHALVEARRPEEALSTLRDQQASVHQKAAQRAEFDVLDDQATAAYCRQLRAS